MYIVFFFYQYTPFFPIIWFFKLPIFWTILLEFEKLGLKCTSIFWIHNFSNYYFVPWEFKKLGFNCIFPLLNSTRRFNFMESLLQNFFLLPAIFPWIIKFLFADNTFLLCLIKQESYICPHCQNIQKEFRQAINHAIS